MFGDLPMSSSVDDVVGSSVNTLDGDFNSGFKKGSSKATVRKVNSNQTNLLPYSDINLVPTAPLSSPVNKPGSLHRPQLPPPRQRSQPHRPLPARSLLQTALRPRRPRRRHPHPPRSPKATRLRRRTYRRNRQRLQERFRRQRPGLRSRIHRRQRRLSSRLPGPRHGLRRAVRVCQVL